MRIAAIAVTSIVAALTLTSCAAASPADTGKAPDTKPVVEASPEPTKTPSEFGESVKNSRGNLVKEIGQLAGTSAITSDVVTSRFAVTDIVVDPQCTSPYPDAPQNGHFLGVHLNVETTPELADESFPWVTFTEYSWQAYDSDGKRLNDPVGNAWSCFDSAQQLPSQIGPGQSVSGWIVLDVASVNGAVVLAMGGSPTGWEWSY